MRTDINTSGARHLGAYRFPLARDLDDDSAAHIADIAEDIGDYIAEAIAEAMRDE